MSRSRRQLAALGPMEQLRAGRLPRRIVQLLAGLVLFGVSVAMLLRGTLGMMPWDVLHQGITAHLPLTLGRAAIATSLLVLLLWVPLRQPPGLGTIANALVIGLVTDPAIAAIPEVDHLAGRLTLVLGGLVLGGVATACYIGAQLGPGPRDGLMTGLARRTGRSIRTVRTGIEVVVVLLGWALGGTLGPATLAYALLIGPLTQAFLPWFVVPLDPDGRDPRSSSATAPARRPGGESASTAPSTWMTSSLR